MKNLKLISLLFTLSSTLAFALPKAPVDDLNFRLGLLFKALGHLNDNQYDFEGIVKLSNCSGSLIKFEGQDDDAKAHSLLTKL